VHGIGIQKAEARSFATSAVKGRAERLAQMSAQLRELGG
jgi:hypothetical protein